MSNMAREPLVSVYLLSVNVLYQVEMSELASYSFYQFIQLLGKQEKISALDRKFRFGSRSVAGKGFSSGSPQFRQDEFSR